MKEYSEDDNDDSSSRRHMSTGEKLCKCLLELLETEQEYVKVHKHLHDAINTVNIMVLLGFR